MNFPSKYEIGDIVTFKIAEYLEPVDAAIISIGFTDNKVIHTIAIPRTDAFTDDMIVDGKLLIEFFPIHTTTRYLNIGYSELDENGECDMDYVVLYGITTEWLLDK